jgi:hypothetical protein
MNGKDDDIVAHMYVENHQISLSLLEADISEQMTKVNRTTSSSLA